MNKDKKEIDSSLGLLAKSAITLLIGILLSKILSYVYRVIIARTYGPDIYGIFLLASSIAGILIFAVLMGFDSGIVRFIPLYKSKNKIKNINYISKFSFFTTLILSIITGFILFALSNIISINIFHEPRLIYYLKVFSFLIPVVAVGNYFIAVLNAYEKIGWYSFIENIWKSFMNVLFLILLIIIGISSNSVPLSFLIASTSTLIISYIAVHKYTPHETYKVKSKLKTKDKKVTRKEFVSFSLPLLFYSVISVIMAWIDSFSIGYFKSATEVGIYNAAVPIALLLYMAPQLFTKLFLPMISREYGNKRIEVIRQLTQQVGKWILLINFPLFLLLFLFPESFIRILFGSEFTSAATALKILLIGTLFLSISRVSNRLLVMQGRTKIILIDILIAVTLNFILNAIFVPMPSIFGLENTSGINGAAIATTLASILIGILFLMQARNSLSIVPFRRKMLNLILAGGIVTLITIFISGFIEINTIFIITISIFFWLLYLFLVIIFKGLDKNDLLVMNKLLKKISVKN